MEPIHFSELFYYSTCGDTVDNNSDNDFCDNVITSCDKIITKIVITVIKMRYLITDHTPFIIITVNITRPNSSLIGTLPLVCTHKVLEMHPK